MTHARCEPAGSVARSETGETGTHIMNRGLAHLPGNAVAYAALFVALSGTAYAATTLPANSVGTKQIKNGAVTGAKIKNGSVTTAGIAQTVWSKDVHGAGLHD